MIPTKKKIFSRSYVLEKATPEQVWAALAPRTSKIQHKLHCQNADKGK